MEKTELVIIALKQRIGEIVSDYETQVAVLRAEVTQLIQERDEKVLAQQQYSEHLNNISN